MRSWFMSPSGAIAVAIFIAIGTGLALLRTIATQGLSARTIAASLLILSFVVFCFGSAFFVGRTRWNWPIDDAHLNWERSFVIAGVVTTVLGLALLEDILRAAGESILARLGMVAFLFGAAVVVVAETTYLSKRDWIYPQLVLYMILTFLAQAAFGAALLRTGLVAGWVAWATVIWNLAWLVVLPIISPHDIYFPVLHYTSALIIGIALLAG